MAQIGEGVETTKKQGLEKGNYSICWAEIETVPECHPAECGGKADMLLQLGEGAGLLEFMWNKTSYLRDRLISLLGLSKLSEHNYYKPAPWEQ